MRIPRAVVLAIAASCLAFGQTYTISTVAGESIPLPNNIPGVQATLTPPPYGLAADSKGNLFFPNGHTVLRLDAVTGIVTVVAGNGTEGFSGDDGLATNAQLSQPFGVAVDGSGNVYIADSGNNRIRKVSKRCDHNVRCGLWARPPASPPTRLGISILPIPATIAS